MSVYIMFYSKKSASATIIIKILPNFLNNYGTFYRGDSDTVSQKTHNKLPLGLLPFSLILLSLESGHHLAVGGAILHGEVTQQLAEAVHLKAVEGDTQGSTDNHLNCRVILGSSKPQNDMAYRVLIPGEILKE